MKIQCYRQGEKREWMKLGKRTQYSDFTIIYVVTRLIMTSTEMITSFSNYEDEIRFGSILEMNF